MIYNRVRALEPPEIALKGHESALFRAIGVSQDNDLFNVALTRHSTASQSVRGAPSVRNNPPVSDFESNFGGVPVPWPDCNLYFRNNRCDSVDRLRPRLVNFALGTVCSDELLWTPDKNGRIFARRSRNAKTTLTACWRFWQRPKTKSTRKTGASPLWKGTLCMVCGMVQDPPVPGKFYVTGTYIVQNHSALSSFELGRKIQFYSLWPHLWLSRSLQYYRIFGVYRPTLIRDYDGNLSAGKWKTSKPKSSRCKTKWWRIRSWRAPPTRRTPPSFWWVATRNAA